MSNRFQTVCNVVLAAGILFVLFWPSASSAVSIPPGVDRLLNDPRYCWKTVSSQDYSPFEPAQLRYIFTSNPSPGSVTLDVSQPNETLIHLRTYDSFGNGEVTYRRVPCPPPREGGLWVFANLLKSTGHVKSTEKSAATGDVTNEFKDSKDPLGGGLGIGYSFALGPNWTIGPFVSFDWLNQTVNHTFANGAYLGTTTHWMVNAGAKLGYSVLPNWQIYGLAGAAWVNQDLNINFFPGL